MPFVAPPSPERGGKLPDCRGLRELREVHGWSYQDIMDEYGVSNQAVTAKLRRCGLSTPHLDYSTLIPWKVEPRDRTSNIGRQLYAAARMKLGMGAPPSERKRRELETWLRKLEDNDAVVHYGNARREDGQIGYGFHYAKRRPGIDNWIIREPAVRSDRAAG